MKKHFLVLLILVLCVSSVSAQKRTDKKNTGKKSAKKARVENKIESDWDIPEPIVYDNIESFQNGYAVVSEFGQYGLVDTTGLYVVPGSYDNKNTLRFSSGLAKVTRGSKTGFVNSHGTVEIPLIYEDAEDFSGDYTRVRSNGKWGIIDRKGNMVVPAVYNSIGISENWDIFPARLDKWGYINLKGDTLIPFQYGHVTGFFHEAAVTHPINIDDVFPTVIDKKGNAIVAKGKYKAINAFYDGTAEFNNWGKKGILDTAGNIIVSPEFQSVGTFSEGFVPVKKDGKWGFADSKGKIAIECRYDDVSGFKNGLAMIKLGDKYGYIDKDAKELPIKQYDKCYGFSEGMSIVKSGNKYGFINSSGTEVISPVFDGAESFNSGLARVLSGEECYFINKKGEKNKYLVMALKTSTNDNIYQSSSEEIQTTKQNTESSKTPDPVSASELSRLSGTYLVSSFIYENKEITTQKYITVKALENSNVELKFLPGESMGQFVVEKKGNLFYSLTQSGCTGTVEFAGSNIIFITVNLKGQTSSGGTWTLEARRSE